MTGPPPLKPDSFEILVLRELRKAGFEVGVVRKHRRAELPEPEHGFVLELVVALSLETSWRRRALVACRAQGTAIDREVIESAKARLPAAAADVAIVVATVDYKEEALAAAEAGGVALLRVVDGRMAFDASGWNTPGQYPAWLPAYTAQVIDRGIAGELRARLLEAGRRDMILDSLRLESRE